MSQWLATSLVMVPGSFSAGHSMLRRAQIFIAVASALIGASIAIGFAYRRTRGIVVRDVRDAEIVVYQWLSAHMSFWDESGEPPPDPKVIFAEWPDGFGVLSGASQQSGGAPYRAFQATSAEHDSLLSTLSNRVAQQPAGGDPLCNIAEVALRLDVMRKGSLQTAASVRTTDQMGWDPDRTATPTADETKSLLAEAAEARSDATRKAFADLWHDSRAAILDHVARAKADRSFFGSVRLVGDLDAAR
jgi:hypothetical protein